MQRVTFPGLPCQNISRWTLPAETLVTDFLLAPVFDILVCNLYWVLPSVKVPRGTLISSWTQRKYKEPWARSICTLALITLVKTRLHKEKATLASFSNLNVGAIDSHEEFRESRYEILWNSKNFPRNWCTLEKSLHYISGIWITNFLWLWEKSPDANPLLKLGLEISWDDVLSITSRHTDTFWLGKASSGWVVHGLPALLHSVLVAWSLTAAFQIASKTLKARGRTGK